MTRFERELILALSGIKEELRELNKKIRKPPEPMALSDDEPTPEPAKPQVDIDYLNRSIK